MLGGYGLHNRLMAKSVQMGVDTGGMQGWTKRMLAAVCVAEGLWRGAGMDAASWARKCYNRRLWRWMMGTCSWEAVLLLLQVLI